MNTRTQQNARAQAVRMSAGRRAPSHGGRGGPTPELRMAIEVGARPSSARSQAVRGWPGTSTINFRTGKTRANNTIVAVASGARMSVLHSGPPVHFVIDVLGYFR